MIDDSQLVQHLLESGLIDQTTLREGMKLRKKDNASLYETLVRHQFVEESKIVRIVARLLNVPFVDLGRVDLDDRVTSLIPVSMAQRNSVIPIQLRKESGESQLVLGMVDPIDVGAMDEIATHTGVDIRPVLVGPGEIREAIARAYEVSDSRGDADDLLDGLDELAADVLSEENWAEFFDSAEEMDETDESSVISTEMKDRPTTDVFDAVDEVPSLDDLELEDLNEPLDESFESGMMSDLEDWDVDDAITTNREDPAPDENNADAFEEDDTTSRRAEILTANDAESLFEPGEGAERASIASEVEDDPEEDYVDEPTQKKSVEELEAEMADDAPDSRESETAVGVGLEESESDGIAGAAYQTKDNDTSNLDSDADSDTGRTQAGIAARALAGAVSDGEDREGTDWGALGREILKSGDDEDSEAESKDSPDLSEDSALGDEDSTNKDSTLSKSSEPATREIAENDLKALTEKPDRTRAETSEFDSIDRDNTGRTEIGIAVQPRDTPQAGVKSVQNAFARDEETTRTAVDAVDDATKPRSLVDLASQIDWELPDGIEERHLLLALINLVVSQGILTRDELIALASALSESE